MPDVFRQSRTAAAEVLDPAWWNAAHTEFAVFNGGLDRENLAEAVIAEIMVGSKALVDVLTSEHTTSFSIDTSLLVWQSSPLIHRVASTAPVDCVLELDWGGSWTWSGSWSATGPTTVDATSDTVRWRITVNGETIAETGPSDDTAVQDCAALYGTAQIPAGAYEVLVEVQVGRRKWSGVSDTTGVCTNTITYDFGELVVVERRA